VISEVNFFSYLFSSLVAGYVMMAVDIMMDGFLGLFGTYREYLNIIKQFGMFNGFEDVIMVLGHMANSVILALFFVHPAVYRRLPFKWGVAKGIVFGAFWHVCVVLFLLITSLGGAKFSTAMMSASFSSQVSLFFLHMVWGGTLGFLYSQKD
jgi:uncharacterized membrane protein YagU involved in acid resistance